MSVHSDRRGAIKKLKLLIYSPKISVDSFRSKIEETFACPILPNHVECAENNYGGVICDVLSPEIYSSRRIVIYIHGGSFVGGSRASWRGFCARLAAKSFSRVVVPEFRLAPTFPYPAAIEDVQTVFRAVFTELQVACTLDESVSSGPVKPEIVIATDSSGASIASALLFNMRERYRASLTHLVLLSPWLNFTQDENHKKRSDELISSETLSECGTAYTYAANLQNHLVSPLLAEAETLKGFPPVYIQVGEKELLLEDYKKFTELLTQAKISCKLDVWKNMPSLFQFSDESLWETHLALEKIGKLISGSTSETGVHVENQPMLESGIKAEA